MRNPNRLDNIYAEICMYHKKYFPDLRITQLFLNFLAWHQTNFKTDGFYLEEKEFLNRFKKYIEESTGYAE